MRRWQITVLLTLLIVGFLYCDSQLVGDFDSQFYSYEIWIGILIAQPGLLAIWAAFGSESFFARLPRAVFLACFVSLAVAWGEWLNGAGWLGFSDLWTVAFTFFQFAIMVVLFGLIRRYRNWQIVGGADFDSSASLKSDRNFSLRRLFVWQGMVVLIMALGTLLLRSSAMDVRQSFSLEFLYQSLLIAAIFGGATFSVVFNCGAVLSIEKKVKHLLAVSCCTCLAFGGVLLAMSISQGSWVSIDDWVPLLIVLVAFHTSTLVVFFIVRLMGYRLVRVSVEGFAASTVEVAPKFEPSTKRFVISIAALLLLLLATAPLALAIRDDRLVHAETREDIKHYELGIQVIEREDGSVKRVDFFQAQVVEGKALMAVRRWWPELSCLEFTGSKIVDSQLESVGQMVNLKTLFLDGTPITDAGLQHLEGLQSLRELYLEDSQVTPEGVSRLQELLPDCQIIYSYPLDVFPNL